MDLDLSDLRETLTISLQPIAYNGEKGIKNIVGLIMDENSYNARHGANFPTTSRPAIYDVNIPINTSYSMRVHREAAHISKKKYYRLFAPLSGG